ncbi:MAG: sugar phosphate isomerase/epimerase [Lentisphaeraceae bacterium]|nr:sugar phosphate isomerase/epimerase [Lentisphaeraceae bacterium]
MDFNRRSFIKTSSQLLATSSILPSVLTAQGMNKNRFTIALSQYSLRALIKDGSLKAEDFPAFTMDTFGIKAIDLWEGGLPKNKLNDMAYMELLRGKAEAAGTDLFLLMAGKLQSNPKKAAKSIASFDKSLDRAKALGCDFLRIFLHAENVQDSVEALKKISDNAAKRGVTIIIEPSPGSKSQYGKFLAEVSQKLNHPNCTLMPDFGKQKNNVYDGTQAMLPYSKSVSAKMHSFDDKGLQPDFDYNRLSKIIIDSNFKGYIAIEWEGRKLKPIPGVKASQKLLIDSFAKHGVKIS